MVRITILVPLLGIQDGRLNLRILRIKSIPVCCYLFINSLVLPNFKKKNLKFLWHHSTTPWKSFLPLIENNFQCKEVQK
uniref:Uncharacterized protein n=1 Tax=Populus trichocarpa TaxID=3694 RepID=A0A2K2C458_POPTR